MTAEDTRTTVPSESNCKAAKRGKAPWRDTSSPGDIRKQALMTFIAFLICVVVAAAVIVSEISAHNSIQWENPANF